ncbi:MAG: carbamoyltransferase HypF, partial [Planctomycetaceae bacterium]|nr:carbamoyltransferase HypF [Planctomycetaceae bacterium]
MPGLDLARTNAAVSSAGGGPEAIVAERLLLGGRVQGQGVRPALARLAIELGLRGWVANAPQGVALQIEGSSGAVARFRAGVPAVLPAGAALRELEAVRAEPAGAPDFRIVPSVAAGPLRVAVPLDRAICDACRAEVEGQLDRRAGYALTSCAECGPRYSLLRALPYDRAATTLDSFQQCPTCRREYRDPGDRRFHAQINACPACGPEIELRLAGTGRPERGSAAIRGAVRLLAAGKILALRGVGGYQLLVDATSPEAVGRLRERKRRPAKPLAVMVPALADAEALAWLDADERAALTDAANPIVVVRRRADATLAANVAPGLDTVGVMLPATGAHALIARGCGLPLVVTSGNHDGEPLEYQPQSAEAALASVADAWLHHDREVLRPIDDSVVRIIAGRRATIRLARGLAPLRLEVPATLPVVALGGHQKAAIALCNGGQAALGPHVGDLESEGTRARYAHQFHALAQLYEADFTQVAHDLHPEYFTTRWAAELGLPRCAVQHHHAHVVAGMIEAGWLDRRVLGVAWDGTGYGPDGTIWGGEFLVATVREF